MCQKSNFSRGVINKLRKYGTNAINRISRAAKLKIYKIVI